MWIPRAGHGWLREVGYRAASGIGGGGGGGGGGGSGSMTMTVASKLSLSLRLPSVAGGFNMYLKRTLP